MMIELIILSVTSICLFALYAGRVVAPRGSTLLFSDSFLNQLDEKIFEFIKFIFKLYALLNHNIKTLYTTIPHKIVHGIHASSHKLTLKSKTWIETLKIKPNPKDK